MVFYDNQKHIKGYILESKISDRVRLWRKHLDLTQEEFSSLTGLHIGIIRKYESGINVPGGESLVVISKTGVNLNWLLLGEGPMSSGAAASNEAYIQRLDAIRRLLDELDAEKRNTVLGEIFARVQDAKRIADLENAIKELLLKAG
jgi:transcriptional regulator with XRE-family HTH domain